MRFWDLGNHDTLTQGEKYEERDRGMEIKRELRKELMVELPPSEQPWMVVHG